VRDTYYQSSGNPVQRDRLPAGLAPDLEMLPPARPAGATTRQLTSDLLHMTLAALLVMLLVRQLQFVGALWPYDVVFAVPVIGWSVLRALHAGQIRWLLHPLALLAWVALCASVATPWPVKALIVALVGGGFVLLFGLHWGAIQTAAPSPRERARQARQVWRKDLWIFSGFSACTLALMLITDMLIMKLICIAVMIACVGQHPPQHLVRSLASVAWESIVAWFTYDAAPLPGLLQSPVAPRYYRYCLAVASAALVGIVLMQWPGSPLYGLYQLASKLRDTIVVANNADSDRYLPLVSLLLLVLMFVLPVICTLGWVLVFSWRILLTAAAHRDWATAQSLTTNQVASVSESGEACGPPSILLARVVADGSPVLTPRKIYFEHAHGLGDSGSGKTALFLMPIIEQLISFGDCSLIVVDLKADSHELLATLQVAAEQTRARHGIPLPLKYFSNQGSKATFALNPLTQPYWQQLNRFQQTDILCGATGLTYGTDYGAGYYSSANAAVLYHALKTYPNCASFVELADCLGAVINSPRKSELHPEIRKAGLHVREIVNRLAACETLNVTATSGHGAEVLNHTIDLGQVFQEPQLHYFHLSATLSPAGAPEIARLVSYLLLAAATQVERKHPVFLVIDEFQRMVANNLEYLLQLARSMGVGVILANQSMEDLKKGTANLIPAIEANCRLRQWFSVSSREDQDRLIATSGLTVDHLLASSRSVNSEGRTTVTNSASEHIVTRLTINDVSLASDHPKRSILRIGRGEGFAQFGGFPVIVESDYHISEEEYKRRKAITWPTDFGTFVPGHRPPDASRPPTGASGSLPTQPLGPQWSAEVIGAPKHVHPASTVDLAAIEDLFGAPAPSSTPRRKRRKP
jgi:hypothetical protein